MKFIAMKLIIYLLFNSIFNDEFPPPFKINQDMYNPKSKLIVVLGFEPPPATSSSTIPAVLVRALATVCN